MADRQFISNPNKSAPVGTDSIYLIEASGNEDVYSTIAQILSNVDTPITMAVQTTPANPSSGFFKLYAKSDGWYQLDASGTETKLTGLQGNVGASDNRLVRTDGTGGDTVQGSGISIDDADNMLGVGDIDCASVDSLGKIEAAGKILSTVVTLAYSTSVDADLNESDNFVMDTVNGNLTLTASNLSEGQAIAIDLIIDGTGGYTITLGAQFEAFDNAVSIDNTAGVTNTIIGRVQGGVINYDIKVKS